MTSDPKKGGRETWEDSAEIVFGAFRLSLSSIGNPCHPRNLDYSKKFYEDPLKHAVVLLDELSRRKKESK